MPKDSFLTAAIKRVLNPAEAFQQGAQPDQSGQGFALLANAGGDSAMDMSSFLSLMLPPASGGFDITNMFPLLANDSAVDDVPTIDELRERLTGPVEGDEKIFELRETIFHRQPEPAGPHDLHAAPSDNFQRLMDADREARHIVELRSETALCTASSMHMYLESEALGHKKPRSQFGGLAPRQPNMQALMFSAPQLLRQLMRTLQPAPALRAR